MKSRYVQLVLVAGLAVACRSSGDDPQPAQSNTTQPVAQAKAQPKQEAQALPALPILPHAAPAGEAPQPVVAAVPKTRAERLEALSTEHNDAVNAYYQAIQKALKGNENPSPEEIARIRETIQEPDPKVYLARAQTLLDEDATDLTAFKTIQWMLNNLGDPQGTKEGLALLEKYHMDRPEMGDLCDSLARGPGSSLLAKLAEKSPLADVRGKACFAMAEGLKSDIGLAQYIKGKNEEQLQGMAEYVGAEKLEALKTLDPVQTQQEIEALYERVAKDYAEVVVNKGSKRETTLGKRANAALHEIRDLALGKPAPEIEGADLDSVSFKLSDYRGKVVLLDFWGNW